MPPVRPRLALAFVFAGAIVAGCTQFPEVDATASPGIERAAYPRLLPLGALLESGTPRATPEARDTLAARARALEARAAGLSGPVVDAATRARMARAVERSG